MATASFSVEDFSQMYRIPTHSHKGQNGRLLVIGGSILFHASIFWSADVASKIVDLVHFTSPAMENNDLVRRKIKQGFWQGIVVPWKKVSDYIEEDDCVLIGPGMPRDEGLTRGEETTASIVNTLLRKHSQKKWVVDGGALQEIDPKLFSGQIVITPHQGELARIVDKIGDLRFKISEWNNIDERAKKVSMLSRELKGLTILTKGKDDLVCKGDECVMVSGGNEGMTKGGTGDVLAGMIAALYCQNDGFLAAKVGSFLNKAAGDRLYARVGPYFNASDLVSEIPATLKEYIHY